VQHGSMRWPMRRGQRLPRMRLRVRHRRLMAAALLALATGLAVDAATAPPPAGVPLVVAARDLAAGHALGSTDLTVVRVPREALPDGATGAAEVRGAMLAGPVRRGEAITDARLSGPGMLTAAPPGTLAVPVRVGEPALLDVVQAGHRVMLLAGPDLDGLTGSPTGGEGEILAPAAVVLSVPSEGSAGLLGGEAQAAVLVLALDRQEATRVAAATGRRTVIAGVVP
jgi:pilus assembly protein CpaB